MGPVINMYLPTYRLEPEEPEKFFPSQAKAVASKIIEEKLKDAVYDDNEMEFLSCEISNAVREAVVALNIPRFKVVVQTVIGQMKDQGIRVASRCLWDTSTDNYACCEYRNQELFCNVMVFAMYTD